MAIPINPAAVQDFDQPLNDSPTYSVTHTFSTADILGTFDGLRQGDVVAGQTPVVDFDGTPLVTKEGVDLFPINSEFGFNVTDFDGAVQKDFVADPAYAEGFAGDLKGAAGEQIGLVVSDAPTDSFKTPAKLGTWLAGLGGNTVKASTEHYSVMQNVLSDQRYPGDPEADYQLDDNLIVVGGEYDGRAVADILPEIGDVNADGAVDIRDVLTPNESTIAENIAVSDDYSVTLKDDGKLLYRWGTEVKRPNDVRIEAQLPLPEEWKGPDPASATPDLNPLFRVTAAELVVHHTITNNPNDQIRPEDYENESAIGTLPEYEILPDGRWVSVDDYYAGDGTLYPAGTVLKDPALAAAASGSTLSTIGAQSADVDEGFTNAWYTTMDREPFEPVLDADGNEYVTGPRWRLQPDKYGQDLPGVEIPIDPSQPPPPTKDEKKYEVGAETQTVVNLLDWEDPVSPLAVSAGWLNGSGTTTANGANLTDDFDLTLYVKGDIKPATIYSAELLMDYEEVAINAAGTTVSGGAADDFLVGQGGNSFTGGAGEDLFVLSYGAAGDGAITSSSITDFVAGVDTLGLIDLNVNPFTFATALTQVLTGDVLSLFLNGVEIATLSGQNATLEEDSFLVLNANAGGVSPDAIYGTPEDDVLVGTAGADEIYALGGDDRLAGLAGDDLLHGSIGDDVLIGGAGADELVGSEGFDTARYDASTAGVTIDLSSAGPQSGGHAAGDTLDGIEAVIGSAFADTITGDVGANVLIGQDGDDVLTGGAGADTLLGGAGADVMVGGEAIDRVGYAASDAAVTVDLSSAGPQTGGHAAGDTLEGIEWVVASNFDDAVTGDAGENVLIGLDGDDVLTGGEGNDILLGGAGADVMVGGEAIDRVGYAASDAAVRIDLSSAGPQAGGHAAGDTLEGVEWVVASNFDDAVTGDAGANVLIGLDGDDVLTGGEGNDFLLGGAGADTFRYASSAFGRDVVKDWEDGIDSLDLSDAGLDFGDFVRTQEGDDTVLALIGDPTQQITFRDTEATTIDAGDFVL